MTSHMYRENRKSLNWFVGCDHNCVYCKPSFQRQMKRQGSHCLRCYNYEPHTHLDRLLKPPPKTDNNQFIFFPSSGDVAFASKKDFQASVDYARKYRDVTFLIQTKAPSCFIDHEFPDNVILATTIETNKTEFFKTPSKYHQYGQISEAPYPVQRLNDFCFLKHRRKIITIEPILNFDLKIMMKWMSKIVGLEAIYVGYDNHNCKLPEPPLAKTLKLIQELEKFTEVRVKTLRKAWYENEP